MKIHGMHTNITYTPVICSIFVQAIEEIIDYVIYVEFLNDKNITKHIQFLRKLSAKYDMMWA